MTTHLEPDILECEVRWALGSITMKKMSGGEEIRMEVHDIVQGTVIKTIPKKKKCKKALNMPANMENLAVATGLEMVSFHSNPKERQSQRMFK